MSNWVDKTLPLHTFPPWKHDRGWKLWCLGRMLSSRNFVELIFESYIGCMCESLCKLTCSLWHLLDARSEIFLCSGAVWILNKGISWLMWCLTVFWILVSYRHCDIAHALCGCRVLTTLLENELIPDPFYGLNNLGVPDIADVGREYYTFWFCNRFKLPGVVSLAVIICNLRCTFRCNIVLSTWQCKLQDRMFWKSPASGLCETVHCKDIFLFSTTVIVLIMIAA